MLRQTLVISVISVSALLLAACNEDRYLTRSDSITANLGDAVNTNKATHTVSPWPKNVRDTQIGMDGKRAAKAVENYQTDNVKDPSGGAEQKSAININVNK